MHPEQRKRSIRQYRSSIHWSQCTVLLDVYNRAVAMSSSEYPELLHFQSSMHPGGSSPRNLAFPLRLGALAGGLWQHVESALLFRHYPQKRLVNTTLERTIGSFSAFISMTALPRDA